MADKKISELTTITGANTASGDLFVIVDVDANETKKITRDELTNALELTDFDNIDINGGTIDGVTIGGASAGAGTFTTLQANTSFNVDGTVTADGLTINDFIASNVSPASSITSTGNQLMLQGATNGSGQSVDLIFQQKLSNDNTRAGGKVSSIAENSYTAGTSTTYDAGLYLYSTSNGSDVLRQSISAGGDISFYEDQGITPKMVWDSSDELLLLSKSGGLGLQVGINDSSLAGAEFRYSSVPAYITNSVAASPITVHATFSINQYDNTEGTVDSWSSPSNGSYNSAAVQLTSTTGGSEIRFFTEAGEAGIDQKMVINSAGNVGIGTTANPVASSGGTTVGHWITSNEYVVHSVDGGVCMYLNRQSSDGDIAVFRKDGSTVGSIGTDTSTSHFVIDGSSGDAGIRFGGSHLTPRDGGSDSDGAISLGQSANRFTNLYLSGSVYLGGTTSANALDDYEEGTFTATATPQTSGTITLNASTNLLAYTKIGNTCTIFGSLVISAVASPVGTYVVFNLPFNSDSGPEASERSAGCVVYDDQVNLSLIPAFVFGSASEGQLYIDASTLSASDQFRFAFTYRTA
jgi:hypothetical protein